MLSLQLCLFVTLWTVAHQAPLSMGFSRKEYWSRLPCPSSGDLPNPGIEPKSLASPALQADSIPTEPPGKPHHCLKYHQYASASKSKTSPDISLELLYSVPYLTTLPGLSHLRYRVAKMEWPKSVPQLQCLWAQSTICSGEKPVSPYCLIPLPSTSGQS